MRLKCAALVSVVLAAVPAGAMTINFSYNDVDCSTTPGAPTCSAVPAGAQGVLAQLAVLYGKLFADPITVNLDVEFMGGGGASSFTKSSLTPYNTYLTKLTADKKTGVDNLAVGSLNNVPGITACGSPAVPPCWDNQIYITPANARAVGINNAANITGITNGPYDGVIFFGSGTSWFYGNGAIGTMVDFASTAEHEIDETLGTGSYLDCVKNSIDCASSGNPVTPADLFRYASAGTRSYSTNAADSAYYSYNGGTNLLVQYNNSGSGDYGDWVHNCAAYKAQDQTACAGKIADFTNEPIVLDSIGYDLVPEPATLFLFGIALPALFVFRRRLVG